MINRMHKLREFDTEIIRSDAKIGIGLSLIFLSMAIFSYFFEGTFNCDSRVRMWCTLSRALINLGFPENISRAAFFFLMVVFCITYVITTWPREKKLP